MSRSELPKVLVSACLLGQPVRYDGRASGHPDVLQRWQAEGRVVPLCPEVAGGLPTPRPPAEIPGGQGGAVLDGQAQVLTVTGDDVSDAFLAGARLALELVRRHGIRVAVLKSGSPSCGNLQIYDGSFSGVKVAGEGVTTALLRREGVQVFSELELEDAQRALSQI
ncbi:DUF523 domain-containing protein [Pseudomonas soli]|uniref:DUF523 domain-containing protein n=1 Tax=Pseudomonas soli TaxID=1306993 RepID=UPI0003C77E8D|nr:DUF523 domain-containing protein [Pseudomonas soli]AIN60813.1 hypothetical protein O165_021825 [Pseudomonas soli]MDW9402248.1 DUF523 domain-containing protein [Pseudomonas soli]